MFKILRLFADGSAFGPSIFNLARASKSESPEKLFDKLSVSIFNFKFPNQSLDKSMITISLLDPNLIEGPQVPAPDVTYIFIPLFSYNP